MKVWSECVERGCGVSEGLVSVFWGERMWCE